MATASVRELQDSARVVKPPVAVIETGTESCSGDRQGVVVTLDSPAPAAGDSKRDTHRL